MMVRVDKGTPNENAYRTLIAGIFIFVGILVGLDPAIRIYDEYVRPTPWIVAKIEIQPTSKDKPRIIYSVESRVHLRGEWKAFLASDGGFRLCDGGTGPGTYSEATEGSRSWEWSDWLGRDCAVPSIPFKACVLYDVATPRGARGHFGPYCSEVFDPRKVE